MSDVLICARQTDDLERQIEGTVGTWCADCEHGVWVAPSGLRMIAEHDILGTPLTVVCTRCGLRRMQEEPAETMPLTEDQISELREYRWPDSREGDQ